MIAVAISFGSGILLCADTNSSVPATRIFPRQYTSKRGYARSIFLVSEPISSTGAAVQYCECALDTLKPSEYTVDRMRATIEQSLFEIYQRQPGTTLLVALYSPCDRQYSLFRTN